MNDCLINRCQNNGECIDLVNDFECNCGLGFSGELCTNLDPICDVSNPCLNGGTCINVEQTDNLSLKRFRCECTLRFSGEICDFNPRLPVDSLSAISMEDFCMSEPCFNDGICFNQDQPPNYFCRCQPGTEGERCEQVFACKIPFTSDLI